MTVGGIILGENQTVDFFLGANSAKGFISYFSQLEMPKAGYRSYLLKGGPGTGKSSILKKIAAFSQDSRIERIHCSSDADSLDGVLLDDGKCSIVDATFPHTLEPKYPGAYERVITLYDGLDNEVLSAHQAEIVQLSSEIAHQHARCCTMLSAAESLLHQSSRGCEECVQYPKLRAAAERMIAKEFGKQKGKQAQEKQRLLSAVTNQGVVTFTKTAQVLAKKLYCIHDFYGCVSDFFLSYLKKAALERDFCVYACYCPLQPQRLEHLFIPELDLGFVTQNSYCRFTELTPYHQINAARFWDIALMKRQKYNFTFQKKTAKLLVDSAISYLHTAKVLHDQLEVYYINAMDFSVVDRMTTSLLSEIAGKS